MGFRRGFLSCGSFRQGRFNGWGFRHSLISFQGSTAVGAESEICVSGVFCTATRTYDHLRSGFPAGGAEIASVALSATAGAGPCIPIRRSERKDAEKQRQDCQESSQSFHGAIPPYEIHFFVFYHNGKLTATEKRDSVIRLGLNSWNVLLSFLFRFFESWSLVFWCLDSWMTICPYAG